ncbi:hypothetical protein GIB67_038272 [Kingdonia uniflora]|uniref:tRNA nucleotidyltransferase/poly(A) polymerase RNA and SrmB- binding domain-containing protein n=1 Tax=Kingdonia uniflora TaxID=39325 RepID=A0A7J7MSH9_9MAGN|nr:hypothetical protein GIB67_038272 [Kingdonia uniflora]
MLLSLYYLFFRIQKKIYDYANGMNDIKLCQVRTVVPAKLSFEEDCARILRGLRIAARLGLSIHKETAIAIQELHSSIMGLSSSRLMMELNFMLSYGAAESSLCLLRKFGILEFMLPFHAAYLAQQDLDKIPRNSVMLLKLFSSVDEVLSCDRPSNCSLWVGLLAFHMTLVSNPQSVSVILAFASVLYHGNWGEAVKFVRENAQGPICFLPELSEVCADKSDKELAEDVTKLAVLVKHSLDALTNTQLLLQAMDRYPVPAFSAPIFIPKKSCVGLFDVLREVMEPSNKKRKTFEIDYSELRKGYLHEVRFVIGKVIIDTMNCMIIPKQHCEVVEQQFKLAKEVHDRTLSCLEQKENTKKEKPCLAESHLKEQLKEDVKEESTIRKGEVVQDVKKRKLQAKKEKLCLPESHLKEPLKEDVKGESNIRKGEVVKDVKKRKLQAKKEKPCLPEYHLKALPKEDVKEESNIRKGEVVKDVKKRKLQVKKKKPCLPESHLKEQLKEDVKEESNIRKGEVVKDVKKRKLQIKKKKPCLPESYLKEQLKEDVKEESNIRKGEVVKNVKKLKLQECNLEEKDRKKCSMHCADEILEKVKRDMLKEDKKQWKVQEYNLEKQLEVVTGSKKEYVNEDKIDSRLLLLNERKNATVEEHKLSVIKDNKKCRIPLSAMFSIHSLKVATSTISAAPAVLPDAPISLPPSSTLSPDITPLLPLPKGSTTSPSPNESPSSVPTIPSNPSPPNPDEFISPGPDSAVSPFGSSSLPPMTSASSPMVLVGGLLYLVMGGWLVAAAFGELK